MEKILSRERVKALEEFRRKLIEVLEDSIKKEKNAAIRQAYSNALFNAESIPIKFVPAKALSSAVFIAGNRMVTSVVKGQQVNQIILVQKGKNKYLIKRREIDLPAWHLFEGNKLAWNGVHTLMHEYCHGMRELNSFALKLNLSYEQAEELIADLLSAKIALKMNFPKERILSFYHGRESLYGSFPFWETLKNILSIK